MKVQVGNDTFTMKVTFETAILDNRGKVKGWQKGVDMRPLALISPFSNPFGAGVVMKPIRTTTAIYLDDPSKPQTEPLAEGQAIRISLEAEPFDKSIGIGIAMTKALKTLSHKLIEAGVVDDAKAMKRVRTLFWTGFFNSQQKMLEREGASIEKLMQLADEQKPQLAAGEGVNGTTDVTPSEQPEAVSQS